MHLNYTPNPRQWRVADRLLYHCKLLKHISFCLHQVAMSDVKGLAGEDRPLMVLCVATPPPSTFLISTEHVNEIINDLE
jgi:hypothetical protein